MFFKKYLKKSNLIYMENTENLDLYKEKYLKYKRNYLILKEQISGAGNNKKKKYADYSLLKILPSYYMMYIILDESTYNVIVKEIREQILSILQIEGMIRGSALKLAEYSSRIQFINAPDASLQSDMSKQYRRLMGSSIGIISPEYKLKNPNNDSFTTLSTLEEPYKAGMIYNDETFVSQLNNIISTYLIKKNSQDVNNAQGYTDITSTSNFHGIMIFRFTRAECKFIEAYKLTGSSLTIDVIKNQFYNKPLRIVPLTGSKN
jgi:hypothetical protein